MHYPPTAVGTSHARTKAQSRARAGPMCRWRDEHHAGPCGPTTDRRRWRRQRAPGPGRDKTRRTCEVPTQARLLIALSVATSTHVSCWSTVRRAVRSATERTVSWSYARPCSSREHTQRPGRCRCALWGWCAGARQLPGQCRAKTFAHISQPSKHGTLYKF